MVTKEKLDSLTTRAFDTACSHGFHDVERSNAHFMMLVLSEIGEMVEADRKSRRVKLHGDALDNTLRFNDFVPTFEHLVKDTMEDELADVVIRLLDFCGKRGISLFMGNDGIVDMQDKFVEMFGEMSVCEQCFYLSRVVTSIGDDAPAQNLPSLVACAISFCFEFATFHKIDLLWHIEKKMAYNETRAKMHGKNY